MKTEFQYIRMVQMPIAGTGRKTHIWSVQNIRHGSPLGAIQWDGGWRQYVFHPFGQTIYSAGCLRDITSFIAEAMSERGMKP